MVELVRKCDKCKREIPKNAPYQGVSMFRMKDEECVEIPMFEWDLCPSCSLALKRFITGGVEN